MSNISIGRFDNLKNFQFNTELKQIRLQSKNPGFFDFKSFTPISTDGVNVFFEGVIYSIDNFSILIDRLSIINLIVLTNKEKLLLIEKGAIFCFDITVFEVNFPIFNNIKFSKDVVRSNNQLILFLKK